MRRAGAPLVRTEKELGPPGTGDVLVEVAGCGVCHTDLGFLHEGVPTRHPLPLVLGHEVAGTVVDAGAGARDLVGTKVVVAAVIPCGSCALCKKGRGDICKAQIFPGNDADGGFASHLMAPARGCCSLPKDHPGGPGLARLAVVADAVSTAYCAVKKSGLGPGDFAIFVGAGGVGAFGVQIAKAAGARVLAIDIDEERLVLARSHGAEWALSTGGLAPKDVRAKVRETAKAAGLPATEWKIFETSGSRVGQETAFGLLTHGAVLSVVGFCPADTVVRLSNLMAFAARAEGTWGCPPALYPEVLDLVLSGKVAIDPFIELHPMSAINDVFEKLRTKQIKKRPVLVPDAGDRKGAP